MGDQVGFGGRPLDPGDQVELLIILERPSEPVTVEDERLAKRVKNHGDHEGENLDSEEVVEMEADGVDGEVGQLELRVQVGTDQQGYRHSYASVVAKDSVGRGNSSKEPCLRPDDVVVLDEDWDEPGKEVSMHDSTVLAQGRKNVAYLISNPERRSKKGPVSINSEPVVDVVTLIEGGSSEARVHQVNSKSDNHRALSILEHDVEDKSVAQPRMGSGINSKNMFYNENSSKSFKVRKGVDSRGANRVVLADWIQSTANRIDSLVNTLHHSPSTVSMEVEVADTGGSKPVSAGRIPDVAVEDSVDGVVHDGGCNLSS
ncbi:hypothetical protein V6N11_031701 [Hibiscus sabdariffa]|uniref:Uncharacterized protein n=1 Tax=Hibiscus sabdariffa TaxID=183260 RepID=A0ABR2SYE5_9ROSI